MNTVIFVILVMMGKEGNVVSFKSPAIAFETIEKCEAGRKELFGEQVEILERSRCAGVYSLVTAEPQKDATKAPEAPTEPPKPIPKGVGCVRGIDQGFASGKPCLKA